MQGVHLEDFAQGWLDGGSSDKRQGLMDGGSPAQRGPLLPPARLHGKGPPPFLRDLLMPRLCLRARPLLCYQLLNCSEPDPRCTINCSPPYIPAASICFQAHRQSHNSLLQPLIYFLLCLHHWTWKCLVLLKSWSPCVFKLEVVEWLSLSLKKFRIVKVLVPVCVQIGSGSRVVVLVLVFVIVFEKV